MKGVEKTIRIFHSFEEADAADDLERAQMTPQQRAEIFFALKLKEGDGSVKYFV